MKNIVLSLILFSFAHKASAHQGEHANIAFFDASDFLHLLTHPEIYLTVIAFCLVAFHAGVSNKAKAIIVALRKLIVK